MADPIVKEEIDCFSIESLCKIDISSFEDFIKAKIDSKDSVIDLMATAKEARDADFAFMKSQLKEEWDEERITGTEYASAIIQASAASSQSAIQNLIALKQLESRKYLDKLDVLMGLIKTKVAMAQMELYKEQAKGFKDKTKLESVRMILNAWSTVYAQVQSTDVPRFLQNPNVEDTIQDWFAETQLQNPNFATGTKLKKVWSYHPLNGSPVNKDGVTAVGGVAIVEFSSEHASTMVATSDENENPLKDNKKQDIE